ncbi:MAG TPA: dihydrolipoamide acetyltransferase [Anaeromyxobacter sp.]|nr:dihydrolipoamide acetyltransferase [Anaeromyxobacter sp.]
MVRSVWIVALWCALAPGVAAAVDGAADPVAAPAAAQPAAPAAEPSAAPAQAPAAPQSAADKSELQVRALEERVSDLKEKIFRTKARLQSLQEMVIGGDITTGAKAILVHRNEMGSSFYLESASYALDGAPIFTKVDVEGDLEKREEFEIFNGRVSPGEHQISVQLVYRGHGYGIFSYLEGYKFRVQSSNTFTAEAGKVISIRVVGFEKGGITAELKDRPAIRYDIDVRREEGGPAVVPAASKEGAAK